MWMPAEMALFARVVDLGSFTAAARAVGVPKVAVSRAIASLEKRVGNTLLKRTTRRLALTGPGEALLPFCRRICAEVDAAAVQLAPLSTHRRELRVLADAAWGRLLLTPLVPRFLEGFPDIHLQVEMSGSLPDTPSEEWDVLIQSSAPTAAGIVATPLGSPPSLLCATPGYLSAHPAPEQPAELTAHALLIAADQATFLRLSKGRQQAQVPLQPRLLINDPAVVHAATAAGAGIGVLPEFLCRQGIAMGKLKRVLPDWQVSSVLELHAVCDLRRAAQPQVKALIEFLSANMVPVLGLQPRS